MKETSRYTAIVSIKDGYVKHHWYETREAALRAALQFEREGGHGDLYWSMAEFSETSRKQDTAERMHYFWLDLDCGPNKDYKNKRSALEALVAAKLPPFSMLIDSGNGLHVYYKLQTPAPVEEWKPIAEHLKRACIAIQLHADHAITADQSRILRVPGTANYKNGEPKPVRVLKKADVAYTVESFRAALPQIGPLRDAKPKVSSEWSIDPTDLPPAQVENVLRGCKQVREAAKVQSKDIAEPYWRAVLSVVYRCDGGEQLIHKISQGDPRYDAQETQQKAEATLGPATCEHFSAVNPSACAGCPFAGSVKSPINIPAPAPTPDDTPQRDTKVNDWHITAKGVYKVVETDEGVPQKIWAVTTPVYGETFRTRRGETETDADDAKILLVWLRPDGKWRRSLMPLSLLGSNTKMMEWAGTQGLISVIHNPKAWNMYISELTTKLLQERRVTEYYARLGWHADNSEFVLGTKKVTADGVVDATVERNSPLSQLTPQGDLEKWKQSIALLDAPGLEKHQFCILAGFGSPLLDLMDVSGAAISLAGASGKGKTLAARAALSIYGNPDNLFQSADATRNSTDVHLGTLHSVPYLMDEVTTLHDKAIGDLLYKIANGRGKDSLQRNRSWSTGGSWRLVAFLTTNSPIMEANQAHLTEAQRNRAIELIVENAVPQDTATAVYKASGQHYGVAGEVYLQYLIENRDACRQLALRAVEQVKDAFEGQDSQRFGVWALAAALAGGMIAKKLGLIPFSPWGVIEAVVPTLQQQGEQTLTPEEQFLEVMREWLTEESDRVSVCANGRMGFVDSPVARLDGADLYLHSTLFKEELRRRNVSLSVIKQLIKENAQTGIKMRLAQGTPPVSCIRFPSKMVYSD